MLVGLTTSMIEELASGRRKIVQSGKTVPLSLNTSERREFDEAKRTGFVVHRGRRPNLDLIWFYWCRATRVPFVVARGSGASVELKIDLYDLCDRDFSVEGERRCGKVIRTYSGHPRKCQLYSNVCVVDAVRRENIYDCAMALLDIAGSHFEYRKGYEPGGVFA